MHGKLHATTSIARCAAHRPRLRQTFSEFVEGAEGSVDTQVLHSDSRAAHLLRPSWPTQRATLVRDSHLRDSVPVRHDLFRDLSACPLLISLQLSRTPGKCTRINPRPARCGKESNTNCPMLFRLGLNRVDMHAFIWR